MTEFTVKTIKEQPDAVAEVDALVDRSQPRFLKYGEVRTEFWGRLYEQLPDMQIVIGAEEIDIAAVCHTVPVRWEEDMRNLPSRGWDWALRTGVEEHTRGVEPNWLCCLGITVSSAFKGQHASRRAIQAMRDMAKARGLKGVLVIVRPELKKHYPTIDIERYIRWRRASDNAPLDTWLRTHRRNGAEFARIAARSITVTAKISQWEEWTKLLLPEDGDYVIPEGLSPLEVTRAKDEARYIEPHVWLVYE